MRSFDVLKILTIVLLFATGHLYGQSRNERLFPVKGQIVVKGTFRPKQPTDADVYKVNIRKFQEVSIKVQSNSIFIIEGNECGMYFRLFDDNKVEMKVGDAPAGVDDWSGYVEHAGTYEIRIQMGCIDAVTNKQLSVKKPKMTYSLRVFQPLAPSR